jgi:hypothetical protein
MEDGTFVDTTPPNYQISSLAMKAIGADIVVRILFLIPCQEPDRSIPSKRARLSFKITDRER